MSWAWPALGVQNTGQNVAAAATPPVMAQVSSGWTGMGAFGLGVLFPIAAIFAIPVRAEPPPQGAPEPVLLRAPPNNGRFPLRAPASRSGRLIALRAADRAQGW